MFVEVFRRKGICFVVVENADKDTTAKLKTFRSAAKATKYAKRVGESFGIPVFNGLQ